MGRTYRAGGRFGEDQRIREVGAGGGSGSWGQGEDQGAGEDQGGGGSWGDRGIRAIHQGDQAQGRWCPLVEVT